MLKAENIHKSFGSLQVLKGVDVDIAKGEVVAIAGKSGAGKTSLLQILGTLDRADKGKVVINGVEVSALKGDALAAFRNRHIGFVFQFHQLLPEFSALENVMLPALIAKRSQREAEAKAKELLDFLNLGERLKHKPAQLSGGEKQRVAVARALINNPDIVFADEPSGSLDTIQKEELHSLFYKLRSDMGQTFVIVTHDMSLANSADRVIYMKDGVVDTSSSIFDDSNNKK